jgi:hypothetical protein
MRYFFDFKVVCLIVVGLLPASLALTCYKVKQDCFAVCEQPISECFYRKKAILEPSSDNTCESHEEYYWDCQRNLSGCEPPDCQYNLAVNESFAVVCAPEETYCYDLWRKPQNSRYGKTVVWGFENVHERGCARSCEPTNASTMTGITMSCCSSDLCNSTAPSAVSILYSLGLIFLQFLS